MIIPTTSGRGVRRAVLALVMAMSMLLVGCDSAEGPSLEDRGETLRADGREFLQALAGVAPVGEPEVNEDASEDVECDDGAMRRFEATAPVTDDSLDQQSLVGLMISTLEDVGYEPDSGDSLQTGIVPGRNQQTGSTITAELVDLESVEVVGETDCIPA